MKTNLKNGLTVSVDWLSFTVTSTSDIVDALDLFGYVIDDFAKLPKGARGYRTMYRANSSGIYVLCDGNANMGVHIDVSGSAVSDFLERFHSSLEVFCPFEGSKCYDLDPDTSAMMALLSRIMDNGHLTRLDIAIDDVGCRYFTTDDIVTLYDNRQIVTKFRNMRNVVEFENPGTKTGHTVYFGSRSSDIFLRAYDKRLERNAHRSDHEPAIKFPWVRWELELKDDRAMSAAKMLVSGMNVGVVAVGVLGHYMRMINLDDTNRSRCSMYLRWADFIDGISSKRLTVFKAPITLAEKRSWINRQVMPTLAAIVMADGGSLEFVEDNLSSGADRMNSTLCHMVQSELSKYA